MLGTSARTPSPALCHGGLGAWPPALGGSKGTLSLIVYSCLISRQIASHLSLPSGFIFDARAEQKSAARQYRLVESQGCKGPPLGRDV